jgi:enamine deaminase RidA (YjgF/YER057c/UK114 family)
VVAEEKFVFVAGQGPLRNGEYVPGSIEEEMEQTLWNMGVLLEKSGSRFEHVVAAASGSSTSTILRRGMWLTIVRTETRSRTQRARVDRSRCE